MVALTISGPQILRAEISVQDFKAQANAHRLRIVERALYLANDPEFLRQFPEFKDILKDKKKLAETVLSHDAMKNSLSDDNPILKTLAQNHGVNFRALPESDPTRKKIVNAIKDLNYVDDINEKQIIYKMYNNKEDRDLVSRLIKVLDKHDSALCRAKEFGKCMFTASQWFSYGSDVATDINQEAAKLAKFVEGRPEPPNLLQKYTPEFVKKNGFNKLAQETLDSAQDAAEWVKRIKPILNSAGKVGRVITPVLVGAEAVKTTMNPDNKAVENITVLLTGTSSTSDCATAGCSRFFNHCHIELGKDSSREECIDWLMTQSLDRQEYWRKDGDLDRIVREYSPGLDSLSCEKKADHQIIHFDLRVEEGKIRSHRLRWPLENSKKKPLLAIVNPQNGDLDERVLFHNGEPSLAQQCSTVSGSNCKSLTVESIENLGILAPNSYRALKFYRLQKDNLFECCESQSCLSRISRRAAPPRQSEAQQ